jgi:hypothetical protein
MMMQDLDYFAPTIPGFNGGDPVPAIPILAQVPSAELVDNSSAGPSARTSRTQVDKHKVAATPPSPNKAKKVMRKKTSGIKINDPTPKPSSTPTPPKGSQGKFTIRRSETYA